MVTIQERPSRLILNDDSNWTCAYNPVIYKLLRRDYDVEEIRSFEGGAKIRVRINSNPGDKPDVEVGDLIFVGHPLYNKVGEVVSFVDGGAYIDAYIDLPLTQEVFTGTNLYANLISKRFNYKIEFKIYESQSNVLLGLRRISPFTDGFAKVDVASIVASYLDNENDYEYEQFPTFANSRDTKKSIKFYVTYLETWEGSDEEEQSDIARSIYAVNAVKQIGDVNGQNLHEYTADTNDQNYKADFLSDFEKPVLWKGYPFSLSFIYSDKIDYTISKIERQLDINEQPINSFITFDLDTDQRESVNRLKVKESNFLANAKFLEVGIKTGTILEEDYVLPGYVETGYVNKQ